MRAKIIILSCFIFLSLYPLYAVTDSGYREINTSVGKVVVGLDKETALERFGTPEQASEDIWYYSLPEKFFIVFPTHSVFNIYLYPRQSNAYVDTPMEFKAYAYFSDLKIKDITKDAQFIISEPQNFVSEKAGVIIPKKAGEYQVLAKYNNIFSNPARLKIEEPGEKEKEAEKITERLISIHILPYRPLVVQQSQWGFTALGVFVDSTGMYSVKEITNQAAWYIKQDKQVTRNQGNTISFASAGKIAVLCRYGGMESFSQEVDVLDKPFVQEETLKHITLLPEFMSVPNGKNVSLRAFGTYQNNKVEEITNKVKWEAGDKDMLAVQGIGQFLTKAAGITEVTVSLNGLDSLPAKITVTDKAKSASLMPAQEKRIDPQRLPGDIKNEVDKLKDGLGKGERNLSIIKIIPDTLEVPAGETMKVKAQGIYSDNSREDLTELGDWSGSDDKIAKVSAGKVDTFSPGEARIYLSFKGINSLPAVVKVTGPELISIILTPQSLEISRRAKPALKAEGYFSDSSHKDMTAVVNWIATDVRIIRVERGKVLPLNFGQSGVYAEYVGIKSLAANIKIVFTLDWLVYMVIKWLLFSFLATAALFSVLYALTERRKNNLMNSMDKDPADFIIGLYENTKKILAIFNLRYKKNLTPLSYAELVQKRYSIENSFLLRFTDKFEEAIYSHHTMTAKDASVVLNDYNEFLKVMFSRHNKLSLFTKYCRALLGLTPFFISSR